MFLDDLATLLRVSRSTIERRRRAGAFPIPELAATGSVSEVEQAGGRTVSLL